MFEKLTDGFDRSTDRAVSPVIGVILMVAITVILAAVIGTFVLDLGSSVGQTAPQASIQFQDVAADASPLTDSAATDGNTEGHEFIAMTHEGGDDINAGTYTVQVKQSDASSYQDLSSGNLTINDDAGNANIDIGWLHDNDPTGSDFTVGDTIVLGIQDTGDDGNSADYSGNYDVQIIHLESKNVVAQATVNVD